MFGMRVGVDMFIFEEVLERAPIVWPGLPF